MCVFLFLHSDLILYAHQYIILSIALSMCILYIYIYHWDSLGISHVRRWTMGHYGTLSHPLWLNGIRYGWTMLLCVSFTTIVTSKGLVEGNPLENLEPHMEGPFALPWPMKISLVTHHFIGKVSHWEMSNLTHGWIEGSKVSTIDAPMRWLRASSRAALSGPTWETSVPWRRRKCGRWRLR